MDLKFVPEVRPEKTDPMVVRRQKLVGRINQQIGYARQLAEGKQSKASWVWMNEAGVYFLPVKYGRQILELKKGMFAVQCADLDEVDHALSTIRAMVLAGKLDLQIEKASDAIRSRFKNAKKPLG